MKKLTIITIFCCITNLSFAQSQTQMDMDEVENYKKADKELNLVYNKILKEYKTDVEFIRKLKIAQKSWIIFRDAEIDAIFPAKDGRLEYGSVYPMCWSICLTDLTKKRIKDLKVWLKATNGDVCAGSANR